MKTTHLFLLLLVLNLIAIPSAFSQRNDHRDVHRDLEQLESELFNLIEQKKNHLSRYKEANNSQNQFLKDRYAASPQQKVKLTEYIETLAYEMRGLTITLESLDTDIKAIEATIAKLTRYDNHLIKDDHNGRPSGGYKGGGGYQKAPAVTAVKVVRNYREGPTLIPGKGIGWNNVVVYQVTFSDGSTQTVEDRTSTSSIR